MDSLSILRFFLIDRKQNRNCEVNMIVSSKITKDIITMSCVVFTLNYPSSACVSDGNRDRKLKLVSDLCFGRLFLFIFLSDTVEPRFIFPPFLFIFSTKEVHALT